MPRVKRSPDYTKKRAVQRRLDRVPKASSLRRVGPSKTHARCARQPIANWSKPRRSTRSSHARPTSFGSISIACGASAFGGSRQKCAPFPMVRRRGKDVVELDIEYPAKFLPDDIVLIDIAGISAGDPSAQEHASRVLQERADMCMIVSELERGVSGATKTFLEQSRNAVSHAILVLTKMDETLREATKKGQATPWDQVEHARRIGTRRFAREVGRAPETVLSVAVAAEEALRDGAHAEHAGRHFEAGVDKLFTLLRQERALILGIWSAGIVRRCIGDVAEAERRAERCTRSESQRSKPNEAPNPTSSASSS